MIALKEQLMVEVYENEDGDIVIKQPEPYSEEASFVYIRPENADRFIDAILQTKRDIANRDGEGK